MTIGNIQSFPLRAVRRAEATENASIADMDTQNTPEGVGLARMRKDTGADFNPLMERVIRAQRLAEGRRYRVSHGDKL